MPKRLGFGCFLVCVGGGLLGEFFLASVFCFFLGGNHVLTEKLFSLLSTLKLLSYCERGDL